MNKTVIELIQLTILCSYLLIAWRQETLCSKGVLTWWIGVLAVDLFIWKGDRPPYAKEFLNSFDIGIGLVLIYAKCRHVVTRYVQIFLAVVLTLFR